MQYILKIAKKFIPEASWKYTVYLRGAITKEIKKIPVSLSH